MDSPPLCPVPSWRDISGAFGSDDRVYVTEKLHGQFCVVGFDQKRGGFAYAKHASTNGRPLVNAMTNAWPDYLHVAHQVAEVVEVSARGEGRSLAFYGEIIGPGVRTLRYGLDEPDFFAFDVLVGEPGREMWLPPHDTYEMAESAGIKHAPVLQDAWLFDHESVLALAQQPSILGGGPSAGVIVRSASEAHKLDQDRRVVKYDNPLIQFEAVA